MQENTTTTTTRRPAVLSRLRRGYRPAAGAPLGGYAGLMAAYGAIVAGLSAVAWATGRRLPRSPAPADVALMAVATFRISRLVSKDSVTSPLRAPFTRFEEAAGEGEVDERPRGTGLRHTAGELVSCPFCVSVWTVTALAGGLVLAPRLTRFVAGAAVAVTGSDFLQLAWARARRGVE